MECAGNLAFIKEGNDSRRGPIMPAMETIARNPRRRWLQISLRSMLAITTLICVWLGVQVNNAHRQRDAVAAIEAVGGNVVYDYQLNAKGSWINGAEVPGPEWFRRMLGPHYFCHVVVVPYMEFDRPQEVTDDLVKQIGGLAGLHSLSLKDCVNVTDNGIEHLKSLHALKLLDLERTQVTERGLRSLKSLTKLETLGLNNTKLTDAGLSELTAFPKLRRLFFKESPEVTDVGLGHIRNLNSLETISFSKCSKVTNAGLEQLAGLSGLTRLSVIDCPGMNDSAVASLVNLKQLTWLNLSGASLTDESLVAIGTLTALSSLTLENCRQLSGAGLAHLKGLTELTRLELGHCRELHQGLENLINLPRLSYLDLTGTGLSNGELAHVARIPKLYGLSLAECPEIDDVGIAHLAGASKLDQLWLSGCGRVTDGSIEHLSRLTSLKSLKLDRTQVTPAGIAELRKRLPSCKIEHEPE